MDYRDIKSEYLKGVEYNRENFKDHDIYTIKLEGEPIFFKGEPMVFQKRRGTNFFTFKILPKYNMTKYKQFYKRVERALCKKVSLDSKELFGRMYSIKKISYYYLWFYRFDFSIFYYH